MKKRALLLFMLSFPVLNYTKAQEKVDMYMAGDLMAHASQLLSAQKDSITYDFTPVWKYIKKDISSADVSIANMETTLFPKGQYTGYPRFKTPVSYATSALDAGFDIFLLANNHIYDQYRTGVRRTVSILDSLNVPHTGAWTDTISHDKNSVLLFEKKGIRFAVLNYTYATNIPSAAPIYVNYIDTLRMKKDISQAKNSGVDIIMAFLHWGVEYEMLPQPSQVKRADFLVKNGVRVVIGSHPHVVQPMEKICYENGGTKAVVMYSLGNYLSGQRTIDTQGGAAAHLSFSKNENGEVEITSCSYSLVWVWKPKDEKGVEHFYLLPVNEAEKGAYPLSAAEKNRMNAFVSNARTLFSNNNKDVKERKD